MPDFQKIGIKYFFKFFAKKIESEIVLFWNINKL